MRQKKRITAVCWIPVSVILLSAGVVAIIGRPRSLHDGLRTTVASIREKAERLAAGSEKTVRLLKSQATEPLCRQTMAGLTQSSNLYYARKALQGRAGYPSSLADLKRENLLTMTPSCPAGGRYIFDKNGTIRCNIHGTVDGKNKELEKK